MRVTAYPHLTVKKSRIDFPSERILIPNPQWDPLSVTKMGLEDWFHVSFCQGPAYLVAGPRAMWLDIPLEGVR
jgi:hypothetical protein